jgi:hypothetical protein
MDKRQENFFSMTRGQRSDEREYRQENALRCRCNNAGAVYYTPAQRKAMKESAS